MFDVSSSSAQASIWYSLVELYVIIIYFESPVYYNLSSFCECEYEFIGELKAAIEIKSFLHLPSNRNVVAFLDENFF